MKSIFLRNFLITALMLSICFILIAVSFLSVGRTFIINEYSSDMRGTAEEVRRLAGAAYSGGGSSNLLSLKLYLTSITNSTGNTVLIVSPEGEVLLCSDYRSDIEAGQHLSENLMTELQNGTGIDRLDTLDGLYSSRHYIVSETIPDPDGGDPLGYVLVSNGLSNIFSAWESMQWFIAVVIVLGFFLMLGFSLFYWKRISRPLDEMAAASRRFARGDFSERVKQVEDPEDELGALIDSFNKMADSLESAEKRRTEFISNISHELRTPMTAIGGFADGLLDGTIPDEERDRYLLAIRDETYRLSRLVTNMLDVSRARADASDPSRRTDFDLTELVMQTMLSFESRATAKNLDVDPQLPDARIMVHADRDAITRVVYNLIDNAVKFAREGSCITIRLYKDEYKAYVAVKDEGETIPPDDLPFIFDRFHKSDRSRSVDKVGVGLGLYLVKQIINEHDEDIAVRSENGVTEFAFTLSLAATGRT